MNGTPGPCGTGRHRTPAPVACNCQKYEAREYATSPVGDLAQRIESARLASVELHAATDEMNAKLEEVERLLIGAHLGVPATVTRAAGDALALYFGKNSGQWGLFIICGPNASAVPICKASREHRILATALFRKLIDKLIEEVGQQTADVKQACSSIEALLADFTTRKETTP